jgi:hypothetical protein
MEIFFADVALIKITIEMIYLPMQRRHVEGLGLSEMNQSWRFPHLTK